MGSNGNGKRPPCCERGLCTASHWDDKRPLCCERGLCTACHHPLLARAQWQADPEPRVWSLYCQSLRDMMASGLCAAGVVSVPPVTMDLLRSRSPAASGLCVAGAVSVLPAGICAACRRQRSEAAWKKRKEKQQERMKAIREKYGNPESVQKPESASSKPVPTTEESTASNDSQQSSPAPTPTAKVSVDFPIPNTLAQEKHGNPESVQQPESAPPISKQTPTAEESTTSNASVQEKHGNPDSVQQPEPTLPILKQAPTAEEPTASNASQQPSSAPTLTTKDSAGPYISRAPIRDEDNNAAANRSWKEFILGYSSSQAPRPQSPSQQSVLAHDTDTDAIPSSPPVFIPRRQVERMDPSAFMDEETQSHARSSQSLGDNLPSRPSTPTPNSSTSTVWGSTAILPPEIPETPSPPRTQALPRRPSSPSTHSNTTSDIEASTQAILERPRSPTPNSDIDWDIEATLRDVYTPVPVALSSPYVRTPSQFSYQVDFPNEAQTSPLVAGDLYDDDEELRPNLTPVQRIPSSDGIWAPISFTPSTEQSHRYWGLSYRRSWDGSDRLMPQLEIVSQFGSPQSQSLQSSYNLSDDKDAVSVIPETVTPTRYRYAGDGDSIVLTSSPTLRRARRHRYAEDENSSMHDDQDESSVLRTSPTPPQRARRHRYVILDERDRITSSPTLRRNKSLFDAILQEPSTFPARATQDLPDDEGYSENSDEDSDEDSDKNEDSIIYASSLPPGLCTQLDQEEAESTEEETESTPIQPPARRRRLAFDTNNEDSIRPRLPAITSQRALQLPRLSRPEIDLHKCAMIIEDECRKHWYESGKVAALSKWIMDEKYEKMASVHQLSDARLETQPCFFGSAFFGIYTASKCTLMEFMDYWIPLTPVKYIERIRNGSIRWNQILACKVHPKVQSVPLYVVAALSNANTAQSLGYFNETSDASHICHQRCCISPSHVVIELSGKNTGRSRCKNSAKKMRARGEKIPQECDDHFPPCRMREATLTREEMVVAAYAMVNRFTRRNFKDDVIARKCLGKVDKTFRPHPYTYFHYPGPFPADFGVKMDEGHEVIPFWHRTNGQDQDETRQKREKLVRKCTLNKYGKRPMLGGYDEDDSGSSYIDSDGA